MDFVVTHKDLPSIAAAVVVVARKGSSSTQTALLGKITALAFVTFVS
jgi:hypothetical protein